MEDGGHQPLGVPEPPLLGGSGLFFLDIRK